MTTKIRISKQLDKLFPAPVVQAIRDVQARHSSIKSFSFSTRPAGYSFYAGEGDRYTFVNGTKTGCVEMVDESTIGASGVHYDIGAVFSPPMGTFVLKVSYLCGYYLDIINIVEPALPASTF